MRDLKGLAAQSPLRTMFEIGFTKNVQGDHREKELARLKVMKLHEHLMKMARIFVDHGQVAVSFDPFFTIEETELDDIIRFVITSEFTVVDKLLAEYTDFLKMCEELVTHYAYRASHPFELIDADGKRTKIPVPKLAIGFYDMVDSLKEKIKEIS